MNDKYDTTDNVEAHFEPGSNDRVLSNKLGITDAQDMDDVELDLLKRLYDSALSSVEADQRLAAADIRE